LNALVKIAIEKEKTTSLVTFPRDEGRHPDAENEWWYLNGQFEDDDGNPYSFALAYLAPINVVNPRSVGRLWDHFLCIVDEKKRVRYQRVANDNLLRCSTEKLDLSYGPDWWRQGDKAFSYDIHNEIREGIQLSLDLHMKSLKPPLLINGLGRAEISSGYSYYYSLTHLAIDGYLTIGGRVKHVRGLAWIDRQWGNWVWSLLGGWEWFSIRLNGNIEMLIFYLLHPVTREYCPWLFNIMNTDSMIKVDTYKLSRNGYWRGKSGVLYSSGWTIRVPDRGIELKLEPLLKDQEILEGLWEGTCEVVGRMGGKDVKGRAYVECAYFTENRLGRTLYYVAAMSLARLHMLWPVKSVLKKLRTRG
jgi:predicted secreted hydrolase